VTNRPNMLRLDAKLTFSPGMLNYRVRLGYAKSKCVVKTLEKII